MLLFDLAQECKGWVITKLQSGLTTSETRYRVSRPWFRGIVLLPIIIVLLFVIFVAIPMTRDTALLMVRENQPVELGTFAFFIWSGLWGLRLALRAREEGEKVLIYGFYGIFSIGLLLVGMEEVAWGQWFFNFETPAWLKEINMQKELTFHNIKGLQGHSEFFRLSFGIGGLLGTWVRHCHIFRKIAAPEILVPYFLIITFLTMIDLYEDYWSIQEHLDKFLQRMSEVVEMIISIAALLYIWLNGRMLSAEWRSRIHTA